MRALITISVLIASVMVAATAIADPQYQIYDIGVVVVGDTASQGFGVSTGGIAVGRSFRTGGTQAFTWTTSGGLFGLPNLASRSFCVSNSANDTGTVVGTGATTSFGSNRLPVVWQNGVVSQLPLPGGQTLGDANDVNASGVAVGSVNGGSLQRGAIYSGGSATIITQTMPNGSFFLTAFGINDSGRIVGQGIDPNNAAVNVGIVYDIGSANAFSVGAIPGANGALAFGVSNAGHVVGSSMLNQGSGTPFIYSDANGIVPIPLAAGTSEGSARAVNSAGWAVGTDSSAFAIPFLYDGTTTYRLADLIPAGTGWDLSTNTSSSALGISDSRVIIGTGVFNGAVHAYAMVPALQLALLAVSRRTHFTAGPFDIPLPLSGSPGVECRTGGFYKLVITFSNSIVSGKADLISGIGIVDGSPSFSGNTMTVDLNGIPSAQMLTVRLSNVTDSFSQVLPSADVSMIVLAGDTTGNRTVNTSDIAETKANSGVPVNASTFRMDVNTSGAINAPDISAVKSRAGTSVP